MEERHKGSGLSQRGLGGQQSAPETFQKQRRNRSTYRTNVLPVYLNDSVTGKNTRIAIVGAALPLEMNINKIVLSTLSLISVTAQCYAHVIHAFRNNSSAHD